MAEKKRRDDVPEVFTIAEVAEMFGRRHAPSAAGSPTRAAALTIGRSVFVPADALAEMVANAATKAIQNLPSPMSPRRRRSSQAPKHQ